MESSLQRTGQAASTFFRSSFAEGGAANRIGRILTARSMRNNMPTAAGDAGHSFPIVFDMSEPAQFPPLGPNLKVLLVWPSFPPSFWGFEGVLEMIPEGAMSPPLGLITVAALCPATWTLRLIDHS